MRDLFRRLAPLAAPFAAASLLLSGCATSGSQPTRVAQSAGTPWLYAGSDIPVDTSWTFGVLDNGLRYAVRRNGVPPGQVSVRVRIDAGSLMERDGEEGFAHFIEHLSFRGSTYVPDGEAKRVWQRLGATFGADSNASTTPTQTVYQLDLPSATPLGLDESLRILSGMMTGPQIETAIVDSERQVILAESRESADAQRRASDATRALFFAGQPLAERAPIGTPDSLNGATAEALAAFHERWYRPENAVVVIAGDVDPRILEAMVRRHFSAWTGRGRPTPAPDFGAPQDGAPDSAVLVEPRLPTIVSMATLRPWTLRDDTIAFNQGRLRDTIALQIINRRLETRARAGGAFLRAGVSLDDVARSANMTVVSIVPLGTDWRTAVREVRTVIAEAMASPPDQASIDREVAEFDSAMLAAVETAASEAGARQADSIVQAVDIRETVAGPQVALDIFRDMAGSFTPEAMLDSTRRMFDGVDTRAFLSTQTLEEGAETLLAAAVAEPISVDPADRAALADISLDALPTLGAPGSVASREVVPGPLPLDIATLSNGVRVVLFSNQSEAGKVLVSARFGGGALALPATGPSLGWTGPLALVQSGIGPFGQDELDRLATGRRISLGFAVGDDRFELRAVTRAADLADQLRLMAAKLQNPSWDPNPIVRARATTLVGYDASRGSPLSVLGRELPGLVRGGDPRWAVPDRADIEALDADAFRAFWEPLLTTGPIELMIFGDVPAEEALRLAQETFGALPPRTATAAVAPAAIPAATATGTPLMLSHSGTPEQAAAVVGWPAGGGTAEPFEARKLEVLAAIFNDRLFERLRQIEGASYSPSVFSDWPERLPSGGAIVAASAVSTARIDDFTRLVDVIATELRTTPVAADELERARGPLVNLFLRASTGNTFWLERLAGVSFDRRPLTTTLQTPADYQRITPADVQAAAERWLRPETRWSAVVRPEAAQAAAR